jgi:hypothetical protein
MAADAFFKERRFETAVYLVRRFGNRRSLDEMSRALRQR